MKWPTKIAQSFLHLMFPPLCLYCQSSLEDDHPTFCRACTDLLQFINPEERCNYCFGELDRARAARACAECAGKAAILHGVAAAFDYVGPAACLVKRMKYGNQPGLAAGSAAFMVAQFSRFDWPMPDIIVPAPMPIIRQLARGYNQSQLLAEEISKYLQRPVINALHRKCGDYSQAGLSLEQRAALNSSTFVLRPEMDFVDQSILLIDDVTTSGTTLRRCAEVLQRGCPTAIYGLTLCRA